MVQNVSVPRDELRGDECWSSRNEKNWSENEKAYVDVAHDPAVASNSQSSLPNLTRYQPPTPVQIQNALMSCGLDVAEFVLVYSNAGVNSMPTVLSSPGLQRYAHRIMNDQACSTFTRSVMRSRAEIGLQNPEDARSLSHFDAEAGHQSPWDHRLLSSSDYRLTDAKTEDSDEGRSPLSRKRPRIRRHHQDSTDDHPVSVTKTQPLTIGNNAEVNQFYYIRFKDMQQSACKVMGKAFVKLVEPRKQTHHPYTGGNDKAPSWWPPTIGEGAVRHKEPDHLLKPVIERINLLAHILKMIIEPSEQQNPTVQKLGLNVKKLEETTMEVMSNWFNDKEHPENAQKKKYLKEIFRVAKAQERYKRGEIDGTTTIPVMCGTENRAQDGSDDEDDVTSFVNEVDVEVAEGLQPAATVAHSPENIVSPPLLQHSDPELRPLSQSIRQNLQRGSIAPGTYESQIYRLDPTSYQPAQQPIPNLLDTGRRSFAPSGFNTTSSSIPSQWPTPMMNNPGTSSIFYSQPSSSFTYLPPPQQQQQQQSVHTAHHGFEGLHIGSASTSRGSYESGHSLGSQQSPQQQSLRTTNLTSPLNYPSHALSPYGYGGHANNVYNQPEPDIKHEQHQHRPS